METSDALQVKKSRKAHTCDWCYEVIEKGTSYWRWFTYGENVMARMHPECYKAMLDTDLDDGILPPAGTYRRGCSCGENEEHCMCGTPGNKAKKGFPD